MQPWLAGDRLKSSPRKERANNSDAGGGGTSPSTSINDSKSPPSWKDPDAYQRRLSASNQIPTLRNRWRCHPLFVLLLGEYHLSLVYSFVIIIALWREPYICPSLEISFDFSTSGGKGFPPSQSQRRIFTTDYAKNIWTCWCLLILQDAPFDHLRVDGQK